MNTLQVIETAYRATLEEQDDTIVWLTYAMVGAGGRFGVLLTGNAVCYGTRGQRASELSMGDWLQTHAPDVSSDLALLAAKGVRLYAVGEDLEERGIPGSRLIDGLNVLPRRQIARLLEEYARVWHW